ncbi:PQQ-binding-like beta-propeller repeat protein [Ruania alba]|uniref:Uncharacterized protein n=1 Tax=Ruania alba TaxID=648782 RepID=A0A1H5MQT1_9MICO|nr:PQQ-binding-like beta-propeller repeat protein [Ruania alba]SEE91729.1 hypothetical protein SAMN04488554_3571 [Ruania alba]
MAARHTRTRPLNVDRTAGFTRRGFLSGALGTGVVAAGFGVPAIAPAAGATASASSTNLGPAIETVNVRSVTYGELPDGRQVAYATSNGEPATFTMIDITTGESLFATEIDGANLGGFIAIAPDGTVFFTARSPMRGGLFSFDPVSHDVIQIAEDIAGQRVLYDGTFDSGGILYFGTYPDAKVIAYDPSTGEFRDYGTQTEDAAYVFGLGIVDGEIWAGTGPVPHLYRIDPDSGERTEMQPPAHVMDGADWFIAIEPRDDLVFVRLSPRGAYDMAVYDRSQGRWLDDIVEGTFAAALTQPGLGHKAYFLTGDVLTGYHLRDQRTFSTGFEHSDLRAAMAGAVGTYGITVTEIAGLPADTVVGLNTDGHLWHYNLATRRHALIDADILGTPAGAHSIGVGPDGRVYLGAYLSSGAMSRIDPESQQIEQLRGPKQADAIGAHDGWLAVSSYPGAIVHLGAPDEDWADFERILELRRGAPHYQDRIFAMTSVGDRLAVGSVPDYGQLGGALTIVDPATHEHAVHRNVVPQQSVVSLAYANGFVYGGTSIHGGLSTEPAAGEAELFVWDVSSGERVFSAPVVPGAEVINRLTVGPDALLWGLASDGTVFAFDPTQRTVVRRVATGLTNSNSWGRNSSLYYRQADASLYGNSGGALFRVDPAELELEVLVESGVRGSAMDGQGRIYYAGDINVYRYE